MPAASCIGVGSVTNLSVCCPALKQRLLHTYNGDYEYLQNLRVVCDNTYAQGVCSCCSPDSRTLSTRAKFVTVQKK